MWHARSFLMIALLIASSACTAEPTPERPPNFLVIVVDDLGWQDLGVYGNAINETPHIDNLAQAGVRFSNAYSNAPNCAPARASLMSGQWPPRHGVYTVNHSARGPAQLRKLDPPPTGKRLEHSVVTLAEAVKSHGYETVHIGKWHLGRHEEYGPSDQGFDVDIGSGRGIGFAPSHTAPYGIQGFADGPPGEYLTNRLTDEAIQQMRAMGDKPFLLVMSQYAVHLPLTAEPSMIDHYAAKHPGLHEEKVRYAAMVDAVDRGVGRIVAALEQLHIANHTVVILTSDNGGDTNLMSMNDLRGTKGVLYEGGIRVPLIVRDGRVSAAGRVVDAPVSHIDLFPTMLDLGGLAPPERQRLDGRSLAPLLRGKVTDAWEERPLFWHFPAYLWSLRQSQFRTTPGSAIRIGRYKLIEQLETDTLELFDLAADPGETTNLSRRLPEKTRELQRTLRAWRDTTGAAMPRRIRATE